MPTTHCFFLREPPRDGRARLADEDVEHALKVLRLAPGAQALGLDGQGSTWQLRMVGVERGEPLFETSDPTRHPAPGEPGSGLPWIEVLVSFPRGGRAEEMCDRLVQLGAAALRPLATERTQGFRRELAEPKLARLERVARAACKQSRRPWLPEFLPAVEVASLRSLDPRGATCALALRSDQILLDWAAAAPASSRSAPWRIVVGPEGGWTAEEEHALAQHGARSASLGPNVLRVECAAEAAVAVLVQAFAASARSGR